MLAAGAVAALLLAPAGCTRDRERHAIAAPFDGARVLGRTSATWNVTDEERAFAGGTRLDEPEVRVRYRVDVESDLEDKLYLALDGFTLLDDAGLALGDDPATGVCTLGPGTTEAVLSGDVWLARSAAARIEDFRVAHHAVPLGERDLARYREWQLQGRPEAATEIDAEIARFAAAPPCGAQ